MSKKNNGHGHKKFAKLRKILSREPTVDYLIRLEGNFRSETPPKVVCDCGWAYGPSENMLELGIEAKKHETDNAGHYRRRVNSKF